MLRRELLEAGRGRREINWQRIGHAVQYYKNIGYYYVEVPWTISPEATKVTFKNEVPTTQAGDLLGSAEQAFIAGLLGFDESVRKKIFKYKKIVTVSPCFRFESEYDELHHMSFMKVELFSREEMWREMIADAWGLFRECGVQEMEIQPQPQGNYVVQEDIIARKVELGSYGERQYKGRAWSYGTGLAEPRMSYVIGDS